MSPRAREAVAGLVVLALAGGTAAQQESRGAVEQRVKLVARTLADSPAALRIEASGHAQAIAHLAEGRLQQARAEEALSRGDLAQARQAADEALQHLGQARRLVPDVGARQAAAKHRHEQWLASLERLFESGRQRGGDALAADPAWQTIGAMLGHARQLGGDARFDDAQRQLAAAEHELLLGLARLHANRELDYTQRATTPHEEYRIEMARHAELSELVPIALRDLRPPPDATALIERYQQAARTLHAQAQQRHEAGDNAAALEPLRTASMYLQRALAAAGVLAPTEARP